MLRLALLALVPALFSCSSFTERSGLYSDSDILLTDRSFEIYTDANNSRRRRTICEYSDGSTLTVEAGYNCPRVYPGEE